jgi:Transposase DDE domain
MRRFIEEADRGQRTLLPECLDDFIDESNPVRVIDAFVDALDLAEMSFEGVEPAATGRPSYRPSVLLKLYIYGYLNRVQSVQQRLDANPHAMRQRRETVEHPFGTMKARMGATHFLTKTLTKVAAEMALSVLAYNLTRVMNIVGTKRLVAAIAA